MKNISLILLLFILFSCKSTGDKTDCEVLHVDLVERPVPTEEFNCASCSIDAGMLARFKLGCSIIKISSSCGIYRSVIVFAKAYFEELICVICGGLSLNTASRNPSLRARRLLPAWALLSGRSTGCLWELRSAFGKR